jgi:hypothetical protein
MADDTHDTPTYHVLLIGIDAYPTKPLFGCVNDIDAVQGLLLDRLKLPPESITRLASPHFGDDHPAAVPSAPATLANMRAALADLGSEKVGPDDRVFIYYSGHGVRTAVSANGQVFVRESLAPVDCVPVSATPPVQYQLLFDYEINALLAKIAARTRNVAVVLDCCHSAGATRVLVDPEKCPARSLDAKADLGADGPIDLPDGTAAPPADGGRGVAMDGRVDDCVVVAACLNHELARESPGDDGVRHGLLTRSLMDALAGVADADLATLPWARIWLGLRAAVETQNPSQHPWMAGIPARALLAGPPVDGDVGIGIRRTGDNTYAVDAGTLMGITAGAKLAVYPDRPALFLPLGSADDLGSRFTDVLLIVQSADRASAVAAADGAPFDLPPGARGRLVAPGVPERLRCAIVPPDPVALASCKDSPMLEITDDPAAAVRLEKRPDDDTWVLVDDVHGAKPGYPVLATVPPAKLGRTGLLFEHYFYYSLPLRLAKLCTDLPGALQLQILACPKDKTFTPEEAQNPALPEATTGTELAYELRSGDLFVFRVRNTARVRLRVTLLVAAASGRVQVLGDQEIDGGASFVFWMNGNLGDPFPAFLPKGATQGIDRIVAVGTSAFGKSLASLESKTSFREIVERVRGDDDKDFGDPSETSAPVDKWTATEIISRTRA